MRGNNKVNGINNTPDATLLNFRQGFLGAASKTNSTCVLAPITVLEIKL